MNWRRLAVLSGVGLVALLALRRSRRVGHVASEVASFPERNDANEPSPGTTDLETLDGIGEAYAERLQSAGLRSVADLVGADPARLSTETDVGEARIRSWIDQARSQVEQ